MELNPLTAELISRGKDLLSDENKEATKERIGGQEVVDQLVLTMRNSCLLQNPNLAILGVDALGALEVAIYTGMALGIAAERRATEGDALLRDMGVE